jgi:hypothetical protein
MPPKRRAPATEGNQPPTADLLDQLQKTPALSVLGFSRELVEALGGNDDGLLIAAKGIARALSTQFHPDTGGDPVRFNEVQEALESVVANPVAERILFLSRITKQSAKPAPPTQAVTMSGKELKSSEDLRQKRIAALSAGYSPESIHRVRSASALVVPHSVYKSDFTAPAETLTYTHGQGITKGRTMRGDMLPVTSDRAIEYRPLLERLADGLNHFVLVEDGTAAIQQSHHGGRQTIATGVEVQDGWYDIRGLGDSRTITHLEQPVNLESLDAAIVLCGTITPEQLKNLNKSSVALSANQYIQHQELIAGAIDPSQADKSSKAAFDARFQVTPDNMEQLLIGSNRHLGVINPVAENEAILLGLDVRDGSGIILGKIQSLLTTPFL